LRAQFYETLPFCRAFKDYDGQPIKLSEQQDCQEYAAQLFDKLESALRPTAARGLMEATFRGAFMQQVRTQGSWHYSLQLLRTARWARRW